MSQGKKEAQTAVEKSQREMNSRPSSAATSGVPLTGWFTAANVWLEAHLDWMMWVIVLAGLCLRVRHASGSYLSGDEATIMTPPLQHGLINVYRAALPLAHAPMMSFLLYFMTFFGNSELYFRMPAVLCGTLLVFVGYKWAAETFGKTAGLMTGCFLAFAPPLVILSATLRYYMMQALFMACSLYCLERAFREQSRKWMQLFGVCILLATLTEYISAFYLAALGIYAGVRILRKELPKPLIVEWVITQAAALVVLIIGFGTQFYNLRGNTDERFAREVWLREWYFHPESESLLHFLRHGTLNLFRYAFANSGLGPLMLLVFLIGIGLVLQGKVRTPMDRKWAVLLLVLPFIVTAAAGVLTVYPYGGSRHDAFLLVFMAAGISVALSALARGKAMVLLVAMALVVPMWIRSAEHNNFDEVPPQAGHEVSKLDQMKRALAYLSSRDPRPQVLVADELGFFTLRYYLCHGQANEGRRIAAGKIVITGCPGYQIVYSLDSSKEWGAPWNDPVETFQRILATVRSSMPNKFRDNVWVFHVSGSRSKGETVYDDSSGRFGKLEIYRFSP